MPHFAGNLACLWESIEDIASMCIQFLESREQQNELHLMHQHGTENGKNH